MSANLSMHLPIILFDATSIPSNRGGVGRVIESTVPLLAKSNDFVLHVVCKPEHESEFNNLATHIHPAPSSTARTPFRLLWEQVGLPRLARQINAQVVFSPHYTFPLRGNFSRVVMIHDLTFFSLPHVHSSSKKKFFTWWLRRLAKRKNIQVVAPSRATASAFASLNDTTRHRTTIAPLGYDTSLFHPPTEPELASFTESLSPPATRWIAFLGTLEPRKNVPALIEAFATLPEAQRGEISLLLSGGEGWDNNVEPAIAQAKSQGLDVRALGYLPSQQLRAFLGGAVVVAYPSLGEGFGLPVLEAMACGAAVVTTRELSLPEVGGNSVFYCETSSNSIANVLGGLLNSPAQLVLARKKSLLRAQEFNWELTTRSMTHAIMTALQGGHS